MLCFPTAASTKAWGVVAFIGVVSEKELRSTKHYFSQFFHKPEQETGTNSSYVLVKRTCWGYNVIEFFGIRERRDLPTKLQLVMQKVRFEHDRRGHGRNNWGWQVTMYAGRLPRWLECCSLIFAQHVELMVPRILLGILSTGGNMGSI